MAKRQTLRSARKTRTRTRRYRGGGKYDFHVVLFSNKEIEEDTKLLLLVALQDKYSRVTMETLDDDARLMQYMEFEGSTGISEDLQADIVVYKCTNPPRYLFNEKMNLDSRLTKLEYEIRDLLKVYEADISLIPAPHGLQPSEYGKNEDKVYKVGLRTPRR
jgi:hypothetical protein